METKTPDIKVYPQLPSVTHHCENTFKHAGFLLALLLVGLGWAGPALAELGGSAVMYHRFGEGDYPTTSVTLEQFEAHLNELETGGYNVVALGDIVAANKTGRELPPKSVAITIDDAYLSVYTEAWPRLKKAGFAFTLFVATDAVDRADSGAYKRYMTWAQVKELADDPLVTIGSQTASHLHMIDASNAANRRDLEKSNRKFDEKLGSVPDLIAYPYGEFSEPVIELVKEMGFVAGFGQHSGAFGPSDDPFSLPRFALNETYGDVARFRRSAGARPMMVEDMLPIDSVVTDENNPPQVGFTLPKGPAGGVNCFASHEGQLSTQRLGTDRIEVRMEKPLPKGRTRLNCTAPANGGRWHWLGRLFYVKE